jgi:hypothetical protein
MDEIPEIVRASLKNPVCRPENPECVGRALGASGSEPFRTFYRTYAGTFGSRSLGCELLDLCDGGIAGQTATCREHHGFPDRYLRPDPCRGWQRHEDSPPPRRTTRHHARSASPHYHNVGRSGR